ncbi:MAG: hypothetical protein HXK40_00240 [Atopobium sp.]|nr:hypothetical protein [Atopobium sp.]
MCDESGKSVNQTPKVEACKAAATATPQVAAQVTAQVKAQGVTRKDADSKKAQVVDPEFARAENEDDDGYDPYSDRRPVSEPLFERDPWS